MKKFKQRLSRSVMRTHVFIVVMFQRTVGRILSGGKKTPNKKSKIIPKWFAKHYVARIKDMQAEQVATEKPETIWQFWDGTDVPEIARASMDSVARHRCGFDRKILDLKTMGNYSDLPDYVHDKLKSGGMSFIHFSDLLRMNLLKNHGGVWMDATDYMTAPLPEYIKDADFFAFLVGGKTYYSYSFMQNCFLRAKKGAFLLRAWHDLCLEYWRDEDIKIVDYFAHQLMFKAMVENNPTARKLFLEMPQVSEDQALQFVGAKQFAKFDAKEWERIKSESFFQKLTYKAWQEPSFLRKFSKEYWRKKGTRADVADHPGSFYEKLAKGEIS